MKIVLYIPNIRKFVDNNDNFVESESDARIFDTILEADGHSAYLEHVLGVQCYAKLHTGSKQ